MIDSETNQCLSVKLHELNTMPYGISTGHRVLPPNRFHYARLLDEICETLISLKSMEFTGIINNLQSIRDNQVRELLLKNNDEDFQIYEVDENVPS